MIRISIAVACAALAGCVSNPSVDPGTHMVTNTVAVPYPVPCLLAKDLPVLPKRAPVDPAKATTDQLAAAAAADAEAFAAYAEVVDKLLRACVQSTVKQGAPNVATQPLH